MAADPPGYQPFPLGALAEPVRGYVDAAAAAVGCDPALVGLPLLSTLAGAIGNTRRILLKRGWSEPAILWTANIVASGEHKSPALDQAKCFPWRRQMQARKRYAAEMQEYERAKERYQGELKEWKDGDQSGEPPRAPEPPVMERALVDDSTVEALAPILIANWRGVLLLRDELAGWLGAFDRYARSPRRGGGGDAAKYIEMHGGRPVIIDRRTSVPPTLFVPRAALSVGGGIQPGIVKRVITDEHRDNGLLARLLMAWPPRRQRRWTETEVDEKLTAAVQSVYDALWELRPTRDSDGDPEPIVVPLTPAAKDEFVSFVNAHGAEQYHLEGDLAAAWSKLEGYAARLGLVHYLVRCASRERTDPEAGIDAESIRAGITLARWFGGEDRRIYASLEETAEDAGKRELIELIRRRGGSITERALQRANPRRYPNAEAAETALTELVKAEWGTWETLPPSRAGGRPTRVFRLMVGAER
jgi:hypothetical protein